MGQVVIQGTLAAGPPASSSGFPSSTAAFVLATTPNPKSYNESSGVLTHTLNSPNAFIPLAGCGASGPVTKADTFSFRSDTQVTLQITQVNPAGGPNLVATLNLQGLCVLEFPANSLCVGVSAQGTANLEYFFSGQQ